MTSAFVGNAQVAWDSTSLRAYKTCPRYYQYSILEGWRPKNESPHLKFGIMLHAALEYLDHCKVRGLQDDDVIGALRHIWEPWQSDHDKKNMESLVRSIVWYFDQYRYDNFTQVVLADGTPAVELSFQFSIGNIGEYEILYCGHIDRMVEFLDKKYFLDRKSTAYALDQKYFASFSPDVQMSGYTFASRVAFQIDAVGGIIDAAQVGVGFTRFARQPLHRTNEQLEEWLVSTRIAIAQAIANAEANFFPMNETSCDKYGGCAFRDVCKRSPSVRKNFLEADFEVQRWNPLEPKPTV